MVAEKTLTSLGEPPATIPIPTVSDPTPAHLKRKRSWPGFVRDVFVYFVIYVVVSGVTIGPLFWYWFGSMYADGPKWFARLYFPLVYLCELCPPLRWLVNEWVNWWIL